MIGARVCDSQPLCQSAAFTYLIALVKNLAAAGLRPALRSHSKVHAFNARKDLFREVLTPPLSHPMGERGFFARRRNLYDLVEYHSSPKANEFDGSYRFRNASGQVEICWNLTKSERCSSFVGGAQPPRLQFGAPSRRTERLTPAPSGSSIPRLTISREGAADCARGGRAPHSHCMDSAKRIILRHVLKSPSPIGWEGAGVRILRNKSFRALNP